MSMRSLVLAMLLLAGVLAADAVNNDARVGRLLAEQVTVVGDTANYFVVRVAHDADRF
jgi:hypothetical protein